MYTFQDNSGKSVTLRPEGTAGALGASAAADTGNFSSSVRLLPGGYGICNACLMLLSFNVPGVEFVGSSGPSVDAEVSDLITHESR
ncbi:unnamed protein product [Phytophthora fragariaefolia]|uniref:Unnamed protein product n=1 Tax=Phytophthora fragariaefolia TaxID=1490495 RepID=A0A9W6X8Y1_9STRA|nr:unnamed protein product [Phytophthora fragariaefolia]